MQLHNTRFQMILAFLNLLAFDIHVILIMAKLVFDLRQALGVHFGSDLDLWTDLLVDVEEIFVVAKVLCLFAFL